jgi:hypothetical protein
MIRFTIPMLPPSLNAYRRCHWQAQRRIQDTWKEYGFVEWLRLGKPCFKAVHVTLHFLFPDRRSRDMDNYIATGSKLVGDAIKGRFIPDDDPGHLMGWSFVFGVDHLNPKTIVEIEEVSLTPWPRMSISGWNRTGSSNETDLSQRPRSHRGRSSISDRINMIPGFLGPLESLRNEARVTMSSDQCGGHERSK